MQDNRSITDKIEACFLHWKPKNGQREILHDINLQFDTGKIYGIIGPNGSGKSSFLRHVLGFLPVQEGKLLLDEKEIGSYKRNMLAKKISFVPQETRLDTDFSVYDVVMTGRNPYQKRFERITKEDKEAVQQALAGTHCEHLSEQSFSSLSGGEAQRVIVARAIAQNTEWMLLDEPSASLDIRNQMELMKLLRQLNQQNNTSVIMVLHDINLAAEYCDRLIMLKEGSVLYAGETKEALTLARLKELYGIEFGSVQTEEKTFYYPK